jgi:Bacterial regulatory proteins, gntR family
VPVFARGFLATVALGLCAAAHDGGRLLSGGLPQPAEGSIMPTIDRNERARIMVRAEALDRRTHEPGRHGGCLRRTGLAVLKALLFIFANAVTGRCDPSLDTLARMAGVARSTACEALNRLEAAGLIQRVARWRAVAANGGLVVLQLTNAYTFSVAEAQKPPETGSRSQTTTYPFEQPKTAKTEPVSDRVRALLAVLEQRERRLGLM